MTDTEATTPAPTPAKVAAKHLHASNGTITDTETTVLVSSGARAVTLRVRALPGNRWWEMPPAAVLRRWADEALKDTGRKRVGSRHVSANSAGWSVTFNTEPTKA